MELERGKRGEGGREGRGGRGGRGDGRGGREGGEGGERKESCRMTYSGTSNKGHSEQRTSLYKGLYIFASKRGEHLCPNVFVIQRLLDV